MIYKFPIYWRSTSIGVDFFGHQKYMCVDGIGFLVSYRNEADLTVNNIRRHLMGRCRSQLSLTAENPQHALEKFFQTVPGARVGGRKPESKAVWIDGVIEEYPDCRQMHEGDDGMVCGDEYPCPCFLEGFDALDGCQLAKYLGNMPPLDCDMQLKGRYEILTQKHIFKKNGYEFRIEDIKGYKFVRVHPSLMKKFKELFIGEPKIWVAPDAEQIDMFEEESREESPIAVGVER